MLSVPNGRSRLATHCHAIALPLCALLLAACSAEADNTSPVQPTKAEANGVLASVKGKYEFTPRVCAVHREDGVLDIEVAGPGTGPEGEKFYFDLTSTGNEITLHLGADDPYTTAERQLKAGQYVSQAFTVEVSNGNIIVNKIALVDETGINVDDNATLAITCGG